MCFKFLDISMKITFFANPVFLMDCFGLHAVICGSLSAPRMKNTPRNLSFSCGCVHFGVPGAQGPMKCGDCTRSSWAEAVEYVEFLWSILDSSVPLLLQHL